MGLSQAERVAQLPPDVRQKWLVDTNFKALEYTPEFWLRPEQLGAIDTEAWISAMLAGRGAGKTRVLSEWVKKKAAVPNTRIALIARTSADVRDTMILGDSGIMSVYSPLERPEHNPSLRRVVWPNGSMALTFSAEEPNQLRGPQYHFAACDELASWNLKPDDSGLHAWDNVKIGCRLGRKPQILVATTPKRTPEIRSLIDLAKTDPEKVFITRGATTDNVTNLSNVYIDMILGMYKGTSIERQELYGEMLSEVEGALWSEALIKMTGKLTLSDLSTQWRIVGVDPSVAEKPGDECGIVVISSTQERKLYKRTSFVLDDCSMKGSPDQWAKAVVAAARKWNAVVVAEKNQGGALVKMAINQQDPSIPVIDVTATKGKAIRAEPVVMAYEQGRVMHAGRFPLLEDEMVSWIPGESGYSPNRMDALVWALSGTLVDDKKLRMTVGSVRVASSQVQRSLPGVTMPWRRSRERVATWRR